MVVTVPARYYVPGVNMNMAGFMPMGMQGLGLTEQPVTSSGGYGAWEWVQDLTRAGLDITKTVLTPPSYESKTTPSGSTTTIRYPGGASQSPAGAVGSGQPVDGGIMSGLGMSTNTLLLLGIGVIAVMTLMNTRR